MSNPEVIPNGSTLAQGAKFKMGDFMTFGPGHYKPPTKERRPAKPQQAVAACENCKKTSFIEDTSRGAMICEFCGMVKPHRVVSPDQEYRIYEGDSNSDKKMRVGVSVNVHLNHQLSSSDRLEKYQKDFLFKGVDNIRRTLERLFAGHPVSKPVESRALELFIKAFHWQYLQKKGGSDQVLSEMSAEEKRIRSQIVRKKYSRRSQFVVACIYRALVENDIFMELTEVDRVNRISCALGKKVSIRMVQRCFNDLGLHF